MVLREVKRDEGRRYTDDEKEVAFKVWAFEAERNASKTARLLAENEDHGFEVSRVSISNWATDLGWHDRANRDLFSAAPSLRFKTQTSLILAAPEAAQKVRELLHMDPYVTQYIDDYDEEGRKIKTPVKVLDVNIVKMQMATAQLILDRTGFSPVGTRDIGAVDSPPELNSEWRTMLNPNATEDELRAASEKIRAESGIGLKPGVSAAKRVNSTGRGNPG